MPVPLEPVSWSSGAPSLFADAGAPLTSVPKLRIRPPAQMHVPLLKLYDLSPIWSDAFAGPQKTTALYPLMLLEPSAHADRVEVARAVEHRPIAAASETSNT